MRIASAVPYVLAASAALGLAGCEELTSALNGDCTTYESEYAVELDKSGELLPTISASSESFPMALVLNQVAINDLFARLSDTQLPVLSESIRLLGQEVTLSVQPEIPLLAIGGNQACIDCLSASVPFSLGVGFNNAEPPTRGGIIDVQMPVGLIPEGDRKTILNAGFESLQVTGITADFGDVGNTAVTALEPLLTTLLEDWLRTRFQKQPIATLDSWTLGQGEVLLAGRGPFVYPDSGTMVIAMQSNLPTDAGTDLEVQTALPDGADIGIVFHPNLLLAMSRRMNYEGVIPSDVDDAGNSAVGDGGTMSVTLQQMNTTDDGLLQTSARLWRTDSFCGTADLTAALGLTVEPGTFAFSVQDVQIADGQGFGSLFTNDWVAGSFMDSLLTTLDFTVNYDQVFGGEVEEQSQMGAFQANIDGRGVSVFLNVPGN